MQDGKLRVLGVIGSLNQHSVTRVVVKETAELLRKEGCEVDVLDFLLEPLALYNPDSAHGHVTFAPLKQRVEQADVFLLGTPDYHGSMSSSIKNFLDHFWHEFSGKLFGTIVASHEKGLTVTDQLRTVARQCYAWSLPYGVSFVDHVDVPEGRVASEGLGQRLTMLARDLQVYGRLLAEQRARDLDSNAPGFMARFRNGK